MNFFFLPDDYEEPRSGNSNYLKLQDGENKIRILSLPVIGWEEWENDKPLRYPYNEKPVQGVDPKKPPALFWALIVWDYVSESIRIWQVKQSSIRKAIMSLNSDSDWGNPSGYDLKIKKEGKAKDTRYTVNPLPHKPILDYLKEQFKAKPCSLEHLFSSEDPFTVFPGEKTTPGSWEEANVFVSQPGSLPKDKQDEIAGLIALDTNPKEAEKSILKACGVKELKDIKLDRYDAAYKWIKERVGNQQEAVPF